MATLKKTELNAMVQEVSTKVETVIGEAGVSQEVLDAVRAELSRLDEATKPGKGGGSKVDVTEIANFDENGTVTHIQCSLSGNWLPVFDDEGNENFYTDSKSDKLGGFKRLSKAGESIRQKHAKAFKATKDAVLADMLNPDVNMTQEEANEKIEAAKAVDYSSVGSVERP